MAAPDQWIAETEMTRWEWTDVHSLESLWGMRSGQARLIWTPVEELGAEILTVLAPGGRIFWDFSDAFQAFLVGQSRYAQALCARGDVVPHLDAVCRDLGIERASFLAHVVFGGLTRPLGDRYVPRELDPSYFLLAQRHASVAVPAACRDQVSRYFRRQAQVFGDHAFRGCDEAAVVSGGDESVAARNAISIGVEALGPEDRKSAIIWLTQALDEASVIDAIGLVHACRGVTVSMFRAPRDGELGDVESLLRLRVRAVVEHGTLAAVETTKVALATQGWDALVMADLREALRGMCDARLYGYPLIQTDPFAGWATSH